MKVNELVLPTYYIKRHRINNVCQTTNPKEINWSIMVHHTMYELNWPSAENENWDFYTKVFFPFVSSNMHEISLVIWSSRISLNEEKNKKNKFWRQVVFCLHW